MVKIGKEIKVGVMRMTVFGLRDLVTALENIYGKEGHVFAMPIYKGDDGLYMQLSEGTGFIQIVKSKQELFTRG